MKELETLVEDLKNYLSAKEKELLNSSNFNAYTKGELNNRYGNIESFENAVKEAERNPFHKSQVIEGFQKDAALIKQRIDEITC